MSTSKDYISAHELTGLNNMTSSLEKTPEQSILQDKTLYDGSGVRISSPSNPSDVVKPNRSTEELIGAVIKR